MSDFEIEAIDLFSNLATVLGLPRSVGEIYGLLFVTPEPLAMDALMAKLRMSMGSASQGLRLLRSVGAVKTKYVAGERREHFVAETELRTVASGFLKEKVVPHLLSGADRLARMRAITAAMAPEQRQIADGRIDKLQRWNEIAQTILPLVQNMTAT